MTRRLSLAAAACIASIVLTQGPAAQTGSTSLPAAAVLAPTGTLRAVFLGMNPVQGRIDAQTGKATGPVPDLVEALARRIGVPFVITSAPNAAAIVSALNKGDADVGFLAYDDARALEVDFGAAFMVMFNSYLVRGDSPLRQTAEVDRQGVTVAAVRGQTQELFVSSHVKNAKVRVFETMPAQSEVERLLLGREVDAFAINRQRAIEAEAASVRKLRALPDSFFLVDQSFVVRKGDREKLPPIASFVADAKASGLIKRSIDRAGLIGVDVAK
ncbi:MAG TPA: transporter substrate-binding domain-containing protein [Vicinamibacterales bacterium]|nr:transporter substrate-binding domain-containing protein [Vicinamibacterales bacterium]